MKTKRSYTTVKRSVRSELVKALPFTVQQDNPYWNLYTAKGELIAETMVEDPKRNKAVALMLREACNEHLANTPLARQVKRFLRDLEEMLPDETLINGSEDEQFISLLKLREMLATL